MKTVKNDKAAGSVSGTIRLLEEGWGDKRCILLGVINISIIKGKWVNEWKQGIIYPIKKTMDWSKDLRLTRPITLIETARKITIKILTNRLCNILSTNNVLKGKIMH